MCKRGASWTQAEVDATVSAYFAMLRHELAGESYSKAAGRRDLVPLLRDRSAGAVERKHMNISSVLLDLGYPTIDGYKPLGNRQGILVEAVEAWIGNHPEFVEEVRKSLLLNPTDVPDVGCVDPGQFFDSPPERIEPSTDDVEPWKRKRGARIDFVRRDLENHRLGLAGERFIFQLERQRLFIAGRDDLAKRVEWVSQTRGDGLGFDILSWDEGDESERYVEVKTTGAGKHFPFYVTAPEIRTSEGTGGLFHLYRVFRFGRHPRIYVLRGSLAQTCRLEARIWRATIG